jgi:hypothetical protein
VCYHLAQAGRPSSIQQWSNNVTNEEFAQELQTFKHEFITEVIHYFRAENTERGNLAYSRWKERFITFLGQYTPAEAKRFREVAERQVFYGNIYDTPLESFMRDHGKACLAYIDDLKDSVLKGRVSELQEWLRFSVMEGLPAAPTTTLQPVGPDQAVENSIIALEQLTSVKQQLDNNSQKWAGRILWLLFGIWFCVTVIPPAFLFLKYDWNIAEPYTFFNGLFFVVVPVFYRIATNRELSWRAFREELYERKRREIYKQAKFDIEQYDRLVKNQQAET